MESNTKLPKKHFYLIVISCALIIFCECLQVMMRVKNPDGYAAVQQFTGGTMGYEMYLTVEMSYFFMKVITPMMLGVYAYIAFLKVRIGKLFVFIWTVLLMGGLAYTVIEWDYTSVFYFLKILGYGIGIGSILHLIRVINEQKNSIEGE